MVIVCYHEGVKYPHDLRNNPLSITSNFAQPSSTAQYISITVQCIGHQWFLDSYSLDDFLTMFRPHKKDWIRILFVLKNPEITNLSYHGFSSVEDSIQGFIQTIQYYYHGNDWNHLMFFSKNSAVTRQLRHYDSIRHLVHYYDPIMFWSMLKESDNQIVHHFLIDQDNFSKEAILFSESPMILYDLNLFSVNTILQTPSLKKQIFMVVARVYDRENRLLLG